MKYLNEFRDPELARNLIDNIRNSVQPGKTYKLMEFCGGHTHTIFRYGIPAMLPENIQLLHGPGCPVCVLPIQRINAAIEIALQPDTILCSYGDMLRVPGDAQRSLLKAKSQGADVRMIYSPAEVLKIATTEALKRVVFFAVGFETTTPPTAVILDQAMKLGLKNLFIFCNHVLTPPAIEGILEPALQNNEKILDGLLGPGHVSLITGYSCYQPLAQRYQVPITISGFEPLDILHSILLLVRQINAGTYEVENQYIRAVKPEGNLQAQELVAQYLELREQFEWRGLGEMPLSALRLRSAYKQFDAEQVFKLSDKKAADNKACECPAVLRGQTRPPDCKLFNNPCTPENPLGSCMVSSEGACAAYFRYQIS